MKSLRRLVVTLGIALAAITVAGIVSRPSIVRAVAGLAGRTHLIVHQSKVVQLSLSLSGTSPTLTGSLRVKDRLGSVGGVYVVPAGRVFVVTDVRIEGGVPEFPGIIADLTSALGSRGRFTSATPSLHTAFTGGLAFDSGGSIGFTGQNLLPVTGTATFRVDVLGYETEE